LYYSEAELSVTTSLVTGISLVAGVDEVAAGSVAGAVAGAEDSTAGLLDDS